MANLRDIGNEDVTARTGSELLFSVLGLNNTDKSIGLYTVLVTTKEPITGFSTDNFSSGNFDVNYVKGATGDIVGTTTLDEQDPSAEISLNFAEDFNYVHSNAYGFTRNILLAMLQGQTFKVGNDIITVIGSNGSNKTDRTKCRVSEMNLPCKSIVDNEGQYIRISGGVKDGKPTFKKNTALGAFNQQKKTVIMEIRTLSGLGIQNTKLVPYLSVDSVSLDEGDENSYAISGMRLSDVWERTDFFTEGAEPTTDTLDKASAEIIEIGVDYIVKGSTDPTSGKQGEIACYVDTNGGVTFKKKDSSAWTALSVTATLKHGTRIFARNVEGKEQNGFIVVDTFNSSSKATTASRFDIGATTANYICKVYNYNRDTRAFEPYVTGL